MYLIKKTKISWFYQWFSSVYWPAKIIIYFQQSNNQLKKLMELTAEDKQKLQT